MAKTPKWVSTLLAEVWVKEGKTLETQPIVTWQRSRSRWGSSGRFFTEQNRIHVRAGSDRKEQRSTFLHEIAHSLTPGCNHNETFQTVNLHLQREYGTLQIRHVIANEARYKKNFAKVAAKHSVRGAKKYLKFLGR